MTVHNSTHNRILGIAQPRCRDRKPWELWLSHFALQAHPRVRLDMGCTFTSTHSDRAPHLGQVPATLTDQAKPAVTSNNRLRCMN